MQNVLTVITNPERADLDDGILALAKDRLTAAGASVGAVQWLNPGVAADLPFEGPWDKAAFADFPLDWANVLMRSPISQASRRRLRRLPKRPCGESLISSPPLKSASVC